MSITSQISQKLKQNDWKEIARKRKSWEQNGEAKNMKSLYSEIPSYHNFLFSSQIRCTFR